MKLRKWAKEAPACLFVARRHFPSNILRRTAIGLHYFPSFIADCKQLRDAPTLSCRQIAPKSRT